MGQDTSREVEALRSSSSNRKLKALKRLADIASHGTAKRLIAIKGAVGPLIDLLRNRDKECWSNAVLILAVLAEDEENRKIIIKEGGIASLVRVLTYGVEQDRGCAARALGLLATVGLPIQEVIRTEGAIPMLARLLSSTDQMCQEQAAMALATISTEIPDFRLAIWSESAVPSVVNILNIGGDLPKMWATIIISRLVEDKCNRVQVIKESADRLLIQQLRSPFQASRLNAAAALATLMENNPTVQWAVAREKGVGSFVAMLSDTWDVCKEQAALALSKIAGESGLCVLVIRAGAVAPLLKLLMSQCDISKICALHALGRLSRRKEGCASIVQEGGIRPLVKLLLSPTEEIRSFAVCCLANLAYHNVDYQLSISRLVAFPHQLVISDCMPLGGWLAVT